MSNITNGDNSKSKKGRVVILVRNTLSCSILQFYKVPSKYSEGYSSYRAEEKSTSNKTKGDNSKSKKARVVILVRDTSSGPVLHFYQVSLKYSKGLKPSKYSEGYSSYRADEKSTSNKTKGDNSKSKKARVVIRVRDTSSGPVLHFYQVSLKYFKGSLTYRVDTKSMDNHCQT